MGLEDWVERKAIKHELGEQGMNKMLGLVAWLNAEPGRKRGVAAVLLGLAAALQALGQAQWASAITQANDWIQTQLVPGMDVVGGIMAVWGLAHPFFEGHASNVKDTQAG